MRDEINEYIADTLGDSSEVIIFDDGLGYGYFDAFIGVSDSEIAFYDYDRMVTHIMSSDKTLSAEDAIEWIDYNTVCSIYKEEHPHIVYSYDFADLDDIAKEMDVDKVGVVLDYKNAFIGITENIDGNFCCVYDISKCQNIDKMNQDVMNHAYFIHVA